MSELTPTWPCFAGYLNATHLGEWVDIDGLIARLAEVRHSERFHTVRLILVPINLPRSPLPRDVDPRFVVRPVAIQPEISSRRAS